VQQGEELGTGNVNQQGSPKKENQRKVFRKKNGIENNLQIFRKKWLQMIKE
jgi:hypothetical protein